MFVLGGAAFAEGMGMVGCVALVVVTMKEEEGALVGEAVA